MTGPKAMSHTRQLQNQIATLQDQVHRFCYIFVSLGMKGLNVAFFETEDGAIDAFMMQSEGFPPFPEIGFYYCEYTDYPRRSKFLSETVESEHTRMKAMDSGEIEWERPTIDALQCFLSYANALRTRSERERKQNLSAERLYEQCIRMSCDESSIKFLAKVKANEDSITMLTTDSREAERIDDRTLKYVGEAFAGIAMLAVKSGRMALAVSAASAALCKHNTMLPLINCVRLMAIVRDDLTSQVMTSSVPTW